MNQHPNVEILKNSVQWQANLKEMKWLCAILGGAYGFVLLIALPGWIQHPGLGGSAVLIGLCTILGCAAATALILGVSLLVQWRKLAAQPEAYRVHTVMMDKPHQGFRGQVYFTLKFTDEMGFHREVETKPIFTGHSCKIEDYLNRACRIAYNRITGQVVFLGLEE